MVPSVGMDPNAALWCVYTTSKYPFYLILVQVDLVCGTENALLEVSELEKCEYRVTGTTPALCFHDAGGSSEASGATGQTREEL
jgi:hypothetical protein